MSFKGSYCRYLLILLIAVLSGCGGGGGGSSDNSSPPTTPVSLSSNADLFELTLSNANLEQTFQTSQLRYTASVNFLTDSTSVTPSTDDPNASVSVNETAVVSGESSDPIALSEGANNISVVVTAEDGTTTNTYSVEVTRKTVDEFAQQAYIKASSAGISKYSYFGSFLALSENTLVVNSHLGCAGCGTEGDPIPPAERGVYVFTRENGIWKQEDFLSLGYRTSSLALSGDTLAASGDSGITIFTRENGIWTKEGFLNLDLYWRDRLPSLALSGDTLAVGRSTGRNSVDFGRIYVFTRENGVWNQQALLNAPNEEVRSFGYSIALDGDSLVAGAPGINWSFTTPDDDAGGAVYIFTRSDGAWMQQAQLKGSNTGITDLTSFHCDWLPDGFPQMIFGDLFGSSVALSGDTLVVGAPAESSSATGGESDNSAPGAGAVYVFSRTDGAWSQEAFLKASNADGDCGYPDLVPSPKGDDFGASVALSSGVLAVGAPGEDGSAIGGETDNSAPDAGAAYIFTRTNGVWIQVAYLKASNAEQLDRFGRSISTSQDTIAVGAPREDSNPGGGESNNQAPDAGAVFIFQ